MLVLSRKAGEEILIPELDIVIRVQKIRGKSVSIGIEAPEEIRIARGELPMPHRLSFRKESSKESLAQLTCMAS